MVIGSKVSSKRYIWLRVPRTATKAYGQLFFPDGNYEHTHNNYFYEVINNKLGELPAFSVVRNPYTRFTSAIKYAYVKKIENNATGRFNYYLPVESTDSLADFLTDIVDSIVDTDNQTAFKKAFLTTDISFIRQMFRRQIDFVGFDQVANFRYENLSEYNSWIETNLGYDTSTVTKFNGTGDALSHIDFSDTKIKTVVKKLFAEDFTKFNYKI